MRPWPQGRTQQGQTPPESQSDSVNQGTREDHPMGREKRRRQARALSALIRALKMAYAIQPEAPKHRTLKHIKGPSETQVQTKDIFSSSNSFHLVLLTRLATRFYDLQRTNASVIWGKWPFEATL